MSGKKKVILVLSVVVMVLLLAASLAHYTTLELASFELGLMIPLHL